MLNHLKYLNDVSWQEIFNVWKSNEGLDPVWQAFAKNEKGWDTWEEWRGYQASILGASEREWKLFEILDPNQTVPKFLIGPFQGWQKLFEEKNIRTFEDLVHDKTEWVKENIGIKTRREHFPQPTQFIGLYIEDKQKIVMYEGHHRSAAISLAVFEHNPIVFTSNSTIVLTAIIGDSSKLLDYLLATKANKPV
ncbi:hypothetical protein HY771_02440 [Candidatus Uhrbacteria bacterium]|nr:hypothetical protein [Candidatus Uhrbacteria bacterium]